MWQTVVVVDSLLAIMKCINQFQAIIPRTLFGGIAQFLDFDEINIFVGGSLAVRRRFVGGSLAVRRRSVRIQIRTCNDQS